MNKKHQRRIVIVSVVVAAFLLLFGGLAPAEGVLNSGMNMSQWTFGNSPTWLSVLLAVTFCVLLDRMLFIKKR
jgi:hypothetical protein